MRTLCFSLLALSLTGCASMFPPSAERMARLPVVTFPNQPPKGDFIFKLPAGRAIPVKVAVKGNLLATGAEQTLTTTLAKDMFIHKDWVSEDGKTWKSAQDLVDINLTLSLPSDQHPKPGEMLLTVNRKKND